MYQWLKTMYDVVKTPTTTKKPRKKPPTRNPNRCYFVNRKYVSRINIQWCTIFKICCGLFVSYLSTCIRKLNSLLFIKTIMVYVYFRFLWLLCGCNTSDYLKSKEITIISLIKLTEFLGKTNPNFFNMFINNIINKRNRDLLYQNELEHLLTKQMQNKTKRILISASRF